MPSQHDGQLASVVTRRSMAVILGVDLHQWQSIEMRRTIWADDSAGVDFADSLHRIVQDNGCDAYMTPKTMCQHDFAPLDTYLMLACTALLVLFHPQHVTLPRRLPSTFCSPLRPPSLYSLYSLRKYTLVIHSELHNPQLSFLSRGSA